MSTKVRTALEHADWWSGHHPVQGEMTTTEAFTVLAGEVRRLRDILATQFDWSEDD